MYMLASIYDRVTLFVHIHVPTKSLSKRLRNLLCLKYEFKIKDKSVLN